MAKKTNDGKAVVAAIYLDAVKAAHKDLVAAREDELGGNDAEHDAAGELLEALDEYYAALSRAQGKPQF